MTKEQPTAEQIEALERFAKANGRRWKSELNLLWYNGAYNYAVLGGADPSLLQQVRNAFGPSWLVRFRLAPQKPYVGKVKASARTQRAYEQIAREWQ